MRAAARALRNGEADVALARLTAEVGDEDSEATSREVSEAEEMSEADATDGESAAGEEEEEEDVETDAEVEP